MAFSLEAWKPVGAVVVFTSTVTSLVTDDIFVKTSIPAVVGGILAAMSEKEQKITLRSLLHDPAREYVVISALTGVFAHWLGLHLSNNRPEMAHITGFALSTAVHLISMAAIETVRRGPLPSYKL